MNHLPNKEATKTDKIYHSCYTRNADATRIPINFMNGECCLITAAKKTGKNQKKLGRSHSEMLKKDQIYNYMSDLFLKCNQAVMKQCITYNKNVIQFIDWLSYKIICPIFFTIIWIMIFINKKIKNFVKTKKEIFSYLNFHISFKFSVLLLFF